MMDLLKGNKEIRVRDCAVWLWNASRGFRLPVVFIALIGMGQVAASLFFVWVCKHLIDIATHHCKHSANPVFPPLKVLLSFA